MNKKQYLIIFATFFVGSIAPSVYADQCIETCLSAIQSCMKQANGNGATSKECANTYNSCVTACNK